MSRIGNKPIAIPAGVDVKIDKNVLTVKGPKGTLTQELDNRINVKVEGENVNVERQGNDRHDRSKHGLLRSLIENMIIGVTDGYEKKLEIQGVGYRAEKKGKKLVLHLGFSHPVELEDPEGITTEAPEQTVIVVKGIDKTLVGNYAAVIRSYRKPEPYKGKGVRYSGEYVRRKEGKTGAK